MNANKKQGKYSSFLNMFDIFAEPIYLQIKGKRSLTTSLGGWLSIILILIVTAQMYVQVSNMLEGVNAQITQLTEIEDVPSAITFNASNFFMFAIGSMVNGTVTSYNQTIFNITAFYDIYVRNGDGTRNETKIPIDLIPCTPQQFNFYPLPNDTFDSYLLGDCLCPSNTSFDIQGTYLSSNFSFLQFNINPCNNSNSCAPADYMDQAFYYSQLKLNFYYTNMNIDPLNYTKPNLTYLDSIYWDISGPLMKQSDVFMDFNIVQDYDSYFSTSYNHNRSFYSIDPSKIRDQQVYTSSDLNSLDMPLLQYNVRRSSYVLVTSRIYTKVATVLANIGGFSKSIMVIFAFIAAGYAQYKYHMMISNELYDFKNEERNDDQNLPKPKTEKAKGEGVEAQLLNKEGLSPRVKSEERRNTEVKKYFESHLKKRGKIRYNLLEYIRRNYLRCCSRREDKMADKAMKEADEDIDIIQILQKLKEIDKLKMLLMTHDQRGIFSFIPKPVIKSEDETKTISARNPSDLGANEFSNEEKKDEEDYAAVAFQKAEDYDNLDKYSRLYQAYKLAKLEKNEENIEINKQLLHMLGDELIEVFEKIDEEIGEVATPEKFQFLIKNYLQETSKDSIMSTV